MKYTLTFTADELAILVDALKALDHEGLTLEDDMKMLHRLEHATPDREPKP